eukprot:gnl/TRDRNA2_/TRDRNA2_156271_c3_seq1.p1 gnl/TRDRNA2_/TRDRNA2_156271_c3~~gnl/TRDRNA2_/TRDRNA2_156271_c3_seq1.p1  ORF type:complete len:350 (+),score=58.56 gnl/TRDRNA2_/TRDRNA2_156271_c3_seq1:45-1052(+)
MTCVPIEGIVMAMNALLDSGDVVIAMEPCYQVLSEIAKTRNCRVLPWIAKFNAETKLFDFHTAELRQLADETKKAGKTVKMLILNSPHNPTGWNAFTHADEIYDIVGEETIVFSDEMYGRILDNLSEPIGTAEAPYPSFASLLGRSAKTIVLSGLSKPQGLPGLRLGWLLCEDEGIFQSLCEQKDYATICGVAPGEILGLIGLRNSETLLSNNRARARRNMRLLKESLQNRVPPGWLCAPLFAEKEEDGLAVEPCCTLFIALDWKACKKFGTAHDFALALIDRFGLCCVPGEFFYEPSQPVSAAGLRFGLGREIFPDALAVLEDALRLLDAEFEA